MSRNGSDFKNIIGNENKFWENDNNIGEVIEKIIMNGVKGLSLKEDMTLCRFFGKYPKNYQYKPFLWENSPSPSFGLFLLHIQVLRLLDCSLLIQKISIGDSN